MDIITTRRTKVEKGYELLADITVELAPVTNVDITGLNIGKGDEVLLVSDIIAPAGDGSYLNLFYNGNTTPTNYYNQHIRTDNSSVAAVRTNNAQYTWLDETFRNFSITKIKLTNSGYVVSQTSSNRKYGTSGLMQGDYYTNTTFTVSFVTQITINSTDANHIGIGSRFQLYKIN